MKYILIQPVLAISSSFGKVIGAALHYLPLGMQRSVSEGGRRLILLPVPKIAPVVYAFFYELVKYMAKGRSFIVKKNLGGGTVMELDISQKTQRQIFLYPRYEDPIRSYIEKTLKAGGTFLDIGANVGYYTVIAAGRVTPTGRVFSFEPEEANFSVLKKNVELNHLSNVTLEQVAVADQGGGGVMYLNPLNEGGHSLVPMDSYRDSGYKMEPALAKKKFPDFSFEQKIRTISLDDYLGSQSNLGSIAVAKIDVEGFEEKVLLGMDELLSRGIIGSLVCEISGVESAAVSYLKSKNYLPYSLNKSGEVVPVVGVVGGNNYLFKRQAPHEYEK